MKTWISFYIGKFSKRYRMWYWKTHNNSYLWGILMFASDIPYQGYKQEDVISTIKQNFNKYENE